MTNTSRPAPPTDWTEEPGDLSHHGSAEPLDLRPCTEAGCIRLRHESGPHAGANGSLALGNAIARKGN